MGCQGEALPTAYARTFRAMARQQAIIQAKAGPKPAVNSGLVEPESEQEIKDRQIPEGSLMDNGMLHVVQSGLWEMMGEQHDQTARTAADEIPDEQGRRFGRAS